MRFYDRESELEILEKAYSRPGSDFIVISGRRRIGKSRLVSEFLKDKEAISVQIVPKEEKQVAKDIEEEIRAKLGYSPPFTTFRDATEYLMEQDAGLIFFDEFPNVLVVNQSIPHELQRLWDGYKDKKRITLIVSGSYAGMMKRLFASKKAPLFNRATMTINLEKFSFEIVAGLLSNIGVISPSEQVSYYCILGGVPYYYMLLERLEGPSFKGAVESLFFGVGAQLREEGENVLRQEFGNAYVKYFAILEAINAGYVSMNEISQRLGIRSTTLSKYLRSLQHDFRLVGRAVPFGERAVRSKKGLYFIQDNTLAFWFAAVYGELSMPTHNELNSFIGKRFEGLCREFLAKFVVDGGERLQQVGKWWGTVEIGKGKYEQREIDIVVETDRALYLGECKWTDKPVGDQELIRLRESSKRFSDTKKRVRLVFFSKSGFDLPSNEEVLLFDLQKLVGND